MSLTGGYRISGIQSTDTFSDRVYNTTQYKPSGISAGALMGVALYVYSGTTADGSFVPLRREWL